MVTTDEKGGFGLMQTIDDIRLSADRIVAGTDVDVVLDELKSEAAWQHPDDPVRMGVAYRVALEMVFRALAEKVQQ